MSRRRNGECGQSASKNFVRRHECSWFLLLLRPTDSNDTFAIFLGGLTLVDIGAIRCFVGDGSRALLWERILLQSVGRVVATLLAS